MKTPKTIAEEKIKTLEFPIKNDNWEIKMRDGVVNFYLTRFVKRVKQTIVEAIEEDRRQRR